MKRAVEFTEMKTKAKTAFSQKLKDIREARLMYANKYGAELEKKFDTQSVYVSPSGMLAVDFYAEFILSNMPTFRLGANSDYAVEIEEDINSTIRRLISLNNLDYKIFQLAVNGLRDGIGVAELVVKDKIKSGKKLTQLPDGTEEWKEYTNSYGAALELNIYDVILDEVLIDPLASPYNVRDTAKYVIVKWGDFYKDDFLELAEKEGWKVDVNQVFETMGNNPDGSDVERAQGINKPARVEVHKMFLRDGTVQTILNSEYIIDESLNNKMVDRLPLIFFTPNPGGDTPYSKTLWDDMKHAVEMESVTVNLIADNAIKNISSPIVTDSIQLANKLNISDVDPDEILTMEPDTNNNRSVADRMSTIIRPDMTVGLQFLNQIAGMDAQKISKVSSMQLGVQDKVVRSEGIANAMQSSSVGARSTLIKQTEFTLFSAMARDIIDALYNYYPKFKLTVDREALGDIKAIRVKNGSSLEEDALSDVTIMRSLLELSFSMPDALNVKDILTKYFEKLGLPNIEQYLTSPEESLLKNLLKMNIPMNQAQQMYQSIVQSAQQQQAQGGTI